MGHPIDCRSWEKRATTGPFVHERVGLTLGRQIHLHVCAAVPVRIGCLVAPFNGDHHRICLGQLIEFVEDLLER